jgi:hypothetical protein
MPADFDEALEPEQDRPPAEEVFQRIARRSPVDLGRSVAEILREERERRTVPKNDPGALG